ncbi:hypothetical protein GCM10025791_13770 [Halioxenophilus aromaticivorans]|uniref:Transposase n=1 Tax=Halioxenophilus aromaticivorans TaxID=1306992 RepID=A0AAV3U057_9ALTE
MPRYSEERKQMILSKLLPPLSMSVAQVARDEGIGLQTLYNWRDKAKQQGRPVPGNKSTPDHWSAEAKLATVIETASLNEAELSEYCREKGLYIDQIKLWKTDSLRGFISSREQELEAKRQRQADQQEIKDLKRELREKEKALAETAAILVLRKKLNALWENDNEEG